MKGATMADDLQTTPTTSPPAQTPAAAPSSAPSVPEDYEALKAFHEQYEPVLREIAPVWDDVRPIIENADDREYWKTAREARQRQLDAQKPQLSPELKMIRDEFAGELGPVVEYIKSEQQTRQQRAKADQDAALKVNYDYAARLVAERPALAERNFAGINALAQLAYRDGLSLEEAWKQNEGLFSGSAPRAAAPPTSLRGGAAAPGVPGESKSGPITSRTDLKKRLAANLRAAGMKG